MTNRWYRLQDADRDATTLLDPTHHWSSNWGGTGDPRHGVSVCGTEQHVIDYFAHHAAQGIGYDTDFLAEMVIVELAGDLSDEQDEDAHRGAHLIIPTEVVSVRPLTDAEIAEILADAPVYA